jgi:predicted O-methyltransferase YrrM
MCASRNDLIKKLPKRGLVAEVGTDTGRFALHIITEAEPAELHLIDLDFSRTDAALLNRSEVHIHRGPSHIILGEFESAGFDWIYIDADHSYEAVKRDAAAAADKVRPGGFLVFNDFAHADPFLGRYGVHRAVTEFVVERRWPLVWLAYNRSALYDVALRRPS